MEYEILSDAWARGKLKSSISKVVDFAKRRNVSAVVAVDRKGRPAGRFFVEAWKALHPDEKPPKLFLHHEGELIGKHASQNPEQPILVLDNSASTGKTMAEVRERLADAGAKTILGAVLTSRYREAEGVDLIAEEYFRIPKWEENPQAARLERELGQLALELKTQKKPRA